MFLHQRQQTQQQHHFVDPDPHSPRQGSAIRDTSISIFSRSAVIILLSLIILLGLLFPWIGPPTWLFTLNNNGSLTRWKDYSLEDAAAFVAKNGTIIVCAVSQPYLPFLTNWLISVTRQKHQEKVLVVAEDYATLYKINEKWPGHAVLIPPAPESQTAHTFGSQVH